MKLSMWIINSELSNKYETIPLIVDGKRCIDSVRLFSENGFSGKSSAGYVYIGQSSDFFMGDYNMDSIVLASGMDIIFVRHAAVVEIMNDIVVIFDKYREFAAKLRQASQSSNPFQNMLEEIHGVFECPMFFGQKDLRIYALTQQYSDDEVYEGWDEVKKYYTMPIKLISTMVAPDMQKYPDSIETVAIPVTENEKKHFKYQIRSNVYCGKELWGHLYIYYYNRAVPMSVLQLARYCADAYGELLSRLNTEETSAKHKKYTFLIDMLDGKNVEAEKIENLVWQMEWRKGQKLRMYKISFADDRYNEVFFDFAFMTIDNSAAHEIVFPYQKSIIVIAQDTGTTPDKLFLTVKRVMLDDKYICGVSYPFYDLNTIDCAYFQASFAQDYCKKTGNNIVHYDDYGFAGLITYVRQKLEYKAFIVPSLFELYELDADTGTEYYKTLFWLLANNCHAANTAKKLFIHRNTLKYRIDKITNIINMDIYDPNISAYLRFCYALMIKDYPIYQKERPRNNY